MVAALETYFLPAERLTASTIQQQVQRLTEYPVLEAMLDCSPQMTAILNQERQIVFCNEACAKAGGLLSKIEAIGLRPGELLKCIHSTETPGGCGTTQDCRHCGFTKALEAGQRGHTTHSECVLQCAESSHTFSTEYAVTVRPLPALGSGWQCYWLTNISDEKRRQALERTFLHDLLNRASAIQGVSDVLADQETSEDERVEFTQILSISSKALVEEIQSQRVLLSAERNELAIRKVACNANRVLEDAVESCRMLGFVEGTRLVIESAANVEFETDPTLLGRALVNLLRNALEASSSGEVVTTRLSICGDQGDLLRFSVRNQKVMNDEVRSRIFQRSFSTKGVGRGLGTYSVKLFIEGYLHGRVWFETTSEVGTVFHVELPVRGE